MKIYKGSALIDHVQDLLWYHHDGGNHYFLSRLVGVSISKNAQGKTGITPMYQPVLNLMLYGNGLLGFEFFGKYICVIGSRKPWIVFQKAEEPKWRVTE